METSEILKVEDKELGVSSLLNLNKSYMARIVQNATNAVVDGQYDAINALVIAKKGQELFKALETTVRPIAEDNIKLAKGETYTKFSVDITQKENGVSYDFSYCKDPQWERLNTQFELAKEAKTAREKTLKTFTKAIEQLDPETGEVSIVHPPLRSGKLGLNLSIK